MPSLLALLAMLGAGFAAGAVNALVGSGSLITFPVLLALGLPPVSANISSSLGLLAGNYSSIPAYRDPIRQAASLLRWLAPASAIGGAVGALLLLVLPEKAFTRVVPVLIIAALIMIAAGPTITKRLKASHESGQAAQHLLPLWVSVVAMFLTGVYGGYFGAAQGVIAMGILGITTALDFQVINGMKMVLVALANTVCALIFIVVAWRRVDWWAVAFIALGSIVGGVVGSRLGRRLPSNVLRAIVIVVGASALIILLLRG